MLSSVTRRVARAPMRAAAAALGAGTAAGLALTAAAPAFADVSARAKRERERERERDRRVWLLCLSARVWWCVRVFLTPPSPATLSTACGGPQEIDGAEFKRQLRSGIPKFGLFVNSHSPTVAEQFAHTGYDWILIDTQHGPMDRQNLGQMLCAVHSGGCKAFVRVGVGGDQDGIQQALDLGADGVIVPYINNVQEARDAVSHCMYPTAGTRSVYFPQRSMNKKGLLGYAGKSNDNVVVALQVETADCIKNMEEISAIPGVDMLFLGQNDLWCAQPPNTTHTHTHIHREGGREGAGGETQ
jgi:2-keto-3-deoxy-L-rhamnonate aldolase RhmA